MRRLLFSFILILTANLCQKISAAQDQNFHIYLCFGQSNMEGEAPIESQDIFNNKRFQIISSVDCQTRHTGEWMIATPPLSRCYVGLGPIDYFGHTLTEKLNDSIRIGAVIVAISGTKIDLFLKDSCEAYMKKMINKSSDMIKLYDLYGGNPYKRFIDVAKMAQKDGIIKGILLHQGEANLGDSLWIKKVNSIYNDIITELHLEKDSVPLLAGEVLQTGIASRMNETINQLPSINPNFHIVSSDSITDALDDGLNVHFTSEGYREMGRRYANKMIELLPKSSLKHFMPDTTGSSFDCDLLNDNQLDITTPNCSIYSSDITLPPPIANDITKEKIVGTLSAPEKYHIGNNTIYWTFTDSAGNSSQCPQTIVVLDKAAPIVNCNHMAPLIYDIFTSDCGINSQLLNIQTPYAIDNCDSIIEGKTFIPDYYEIGIHNIDWIFTDKYGNESTCTQKVMINDRFAPVIQKDAEKKHFIILPLNANDISSNEIELPSLFATDNCEKIIPGNVSLPHYFSIGDNNIVWSFSDDSGNISYFQQNIYAIKNFELQLCPIPTQNRLFIYGLEQNEEITLYNTIGQNIYQTKSTGNPTTIDMTNFTDNLYFIFIRNQYYKIIRK